MRKRRLWIAIVLLLVAAALITLMWLRRRAAPEAVRLLPEADAVLYLDLGLIRLGTAVPHIPEVQREPDYAAFVRETGFEFERDLDELALAVHSLPPGAPNPTPPGVEPLPYRSTEILVGRFHADRVSAYLKKLATSTERQGDTEIYGVPYEGRTVRVALLGVDMVAVSNADDPAVMRGIIERYQALARPGGGPALVREHYRRVPLGSVAWAIGRVPATPPASGAPPDVMALAQRMAGGSTVVASVRYTGSIRFRLEAITAGAQEAQQFSDNLGTLLGLFRGAGTSVQGEGPDPDVKAFVDSIEVHPEEQSVVVTATLPERAIQKLVAEPPAVTAPPPPPAPETKKPARKRGRP